MNASTPASGRLSVVGLGPGDAALMTEQVRATIAAASAPASSRGTIRTSSPNTPFSSTPPGLSDEITGVPDASASTATVGSASSSEGSTNRSAAAQ